MKKIDFITLGRSDYNSMKPIMEEVLNFPNEITPRFIAGGTHLLERFGNQIDDIEKEFSISFKPDYIDNQKDDAFQIVESQKEIFAQFLEFWREDKPDMVFLLGDRWEILPIAMLVNQLGIPLVHHSGGDITQGANDNQIRYCVSVLSHIHLVALEEHKTRLECFGEEDWRIEVVGEPAIQHIKDKINQSDIYQALSLEPNEPFALATFHICDFDDVSAERQIEVFSEVMRGIDHTIILTHSNADKGNINLMHSIEQVAQENKNIRLVSALGETLYYEAMAKAEYMIGNSSSGLWEAPSFALPTINIGQRQAGRRHFDNVINVGFDVELIQKAIIKAQSKEFKENVTGENPYFVEGSSAKIINALIRCPSSDVLLKKHVVDPLIQKQKLA